MYVHISDVPMIGSVIRNWFISLKIQILVSVFFSRYFSNTKGDDKHVYFLMLSCAFTKVHSCIVLLQLQAQQVATHPVYILYVIRLYWQENM